MHDGTEGKTNSGSGRADTTVLLNRWAAGCAESGERLLERIYPDLRRLASRRRWNADLSVQVSDIVQELYLRLAQQKQVTWQDRAHFFAVAARLIRRIVVDHLKHKSRMKRGGNAARVALDAIELADPGPDTDVLALDQALSRLARHSPSAVRVVELRYFAGLSVEETAAVLEVGYRTVVRRWRFARAWLHTELSRTSST